MATTTHTTANAPMTTPALARAAGVDEWMLRAALRRGFIEAPAKVGPMHLWTAADLDRVKAGLTAAGYLTGAPADVSSGAPAASGDPETPRGSV